MSTTATRVQAFLSRTKNPGSNRVFQTPSSKSPSLRIPSSVETPSPKRSTPFIPIANLSPRGVKKLSTSLTERTPHKPKRKQDLKLEFNQFFSELSKVISMKESFRKKQKDQLEGFKTTLEKQKQTQEVKDKLTKFKQSQKKVSNKVMGSFKDEALKLDKKLSELNQENFDLKLKLENLPKKKHNTSYMMSFSSQTSPDEQTQELMNSLQTISENSQLHQVIRSSGCDYKNLAAELCKKVLEEQSQRLLTEEKTAKLFETKETYVKELEKNFKQIKSKLST